MVVPRVLADPEIFKQLISQRVYSRPWQIMLKRFSIMLCCYSWKETLLCCHMSLLCPVNNIKL